MESPDAPEINAALFCHLTEPAFIAQALAPHLAPLPPVLITDNPALLPELVRRGAGAAFGLDALPIDATEVFQRLRAHLSGFSGLECVIVDMTWALTTVLGVGTIETWGTVAERLASEIGVTVISLYDQDLLIEEQLQAAFRAHQQFVAPSGLYQNPYWLPRELLTESTLDEQLGFMLGRVVPDFAGTPFFRLFDKAAARGASPDWLARGRPPLVTPGLSARWHIHCLGQLRVFLDGQREVDWRTDGGASKKTRTLFAYLLTRGEKGAHADQIGELLWQGTGSEKTKRARLHHTIAMLRKVLGTTDAVLRSGEYYRLNAPPGSWLDITAFEQLCRRGLSLARHGQEDAALRIYFEAVRLYEGDLFQDLPLEYLTMDSEDWIMPRRTWLREMALRLHYDLSKLLRRYRRYAEALEQALRAVAIDPANESANAEAMRVFHAMGRTDAMHRQFRQYRSALASMGETKEGVEIRAVYDELCRSLDRLTPSQRKTKELILR